jgi:PAS domain S-box-containing protein
MPEERRAAPTGGPVGGPSPTIDDPTSWEPSRAFVAFAIKGLLIGAAGFVIAMRIGAPDQVMRTLGVGIVCLVAVAAWLPYRRGRMQESIRRLGWGVWAYVTITSVFVGGVSGSTIIIYPMIIGLVGWLFGVRPAIYVAIASALATLAMAIAETGGLLPPTPPTPPFARWIVAAGVFVGSAVLIEHAVKSYRNRLLDVQRLSVDLGAQTTALQASESELHRAQAIAQVGSFAWDLVNDSMVLSREARRIFGAPEGFVANRAAWLDVVHREDRERVVFAWDSAMARRTRFALEYRAVVRREVRWISGYAETEFGPEGTPLRSVGTVQDITDRKRAELEREKLESQLRESQKMEALGTLAGGIAHDFNNALTVVLANAELLRTGADGSPGASAGASASLDEIKTAVLRAKDLVKRILAFSRNQPTERRPVCLAPIVDESARLLRSVLPAGVNIRTETSSVDLPAVLADPTHVEQVLLNLGTNAWHAMSGAPQPREIEILVEPYVHEDGTERHPNQVATLPDLRPGRYARVTVRDGGVGMDEVTRQRIFEPFFTTKPVGTGTGLGLAVVHTILLDHQASAIVESAPGAGTTFRLYFPEVVADAALTAAWANGNAPAPASRQVAGVRILFVDDEPAIAKATAQLLQTQGWHVTACVEPQHALATLRSDPAAFGIVITDLNMPEMTGLELAAEVRRAGGNVPVLLSSGYLSEDVESRATAAGVREVIPKPCEPGALYAAVRRHAIASAASPPVDGLPKTDKSAPHSGS